jgi:hypothetical protein
MGIEDMPLQCMMCPRVIEARTNAEQMEELAEEAMSDFSFLDVCGPETIEIILAARLQLLHTAESIWESYHTLTHFYDQQARTRPCPGVNLIMMECGLGSKVINTGDTPA